MTLIVITFAKMVLMSGHRVNNSSVASVRGSGGGGGKGEGRCGERRDEPVAQ